MPDQNNPTDTTATPVQVDPPSEPTQMPPIPPAQMDIPTGDASTPPPFPPEVSPPEGTTPPPDSGSAAPSFDIPPVVTPGQPKKKFGGKRVIATILGLLVLVGGLGAGVILVRQQQDIREKAALAEPCKVCLPNGDCGTIASPPQCSPTLNECNTRATCPQPPSPPELPPQEEPPSPGGGQCTRFSSPRRATGDSLTVTSDDFNKCQDSCPGGTLWVAKYKCDGINLSQGCQDNGTIEDQLITVEEIGKPFEVGSLSCGTVQIDVGCRNTANTWGNVAFLVKSASTACTTSALPPSDGPTAQCLDTKAFDTNWTQLTTQDLSALKPGGVVRFTVAGQASSGSFDKARFKINGVQRPEVTGKRPGTEEYYDEYTIPEGITTFTINAQIHHATLGWSN